MSDMTQPSATLRRLAEIEDDLAKRQNLLEGAARAWYVAKRDKEHARSLAFIRAEGTVAERQAIADRDTSLDGKNAEAEYEALKAVVRVLETRASIGQSILRSQTTQAYSSRGTG